MDKADPIAENSTAPTPPKDKKNLETRALLALAFAYIGLKPSYIGTAIDARELLRDEPTFGAKLKATVNGALFKKTWKQVMDNVRKNPEATSLGKWAIGTKSLFKAFKYTAIIGIPGAVAGAVLGWTLGDRAGSPGEVINHPIDSMKRMFGPKQSEPQATGTTTIQAAPVSQSADSHWQERVGEQQPQLLTANR